MADAAIQAASSQPDGSVFISYARADNEKPPFDKVAEGWVTFFWGQLRWQLTNLGAKRANLWLDRYEIEPAEAFTPVIEAAVKQAKVIVPVLSANWTQSAWCCLEVDTFTQTHVDATERIVPVFKNEVTQTLLPSIMRLDSAREGYRFFTRDPTGQVKEFYWRGLRDEIAYFGLIKEVASSIIKRLGETPVQRSSPTRPSIGHTVFLAFAARELDDARQRLKNDLVQAGVTVVPSTEAPPDTVGDFESVIREALGQAEFAVHFIGERRGPTPEGSTEPIIDMQLRLAREIAQTRSLSQILWAPRWLPDQPLAKRDPFEIVDKFGGLQQGEQIHGEEVTDLSQWLRKHLAPSPRPEPPSKANRLLVVASAQAEDDELAVDMANLAQGAVPCVRLLCADETWSDSELDAVVLIPWSKASGQEINALLDRLPQNAHIICLKLPGGDEAAKRRFFKAGVFVERIDALPNERSQTREFLERLEIISPAGA